MSVGRPLETAAAEARLDVVTVEDWTGELAETLRALVGGMRAHESLLRAQEGDDVFDHDVEKKSRLLEGVEAGLLRRTLVVATR
jgi:hypothetical protein